jgi:acetate kinase
MGTRSGDLDPGVLVHLMRQSKLDAAAVEDLVDHRSGLLGVSGVSSDMRALHEAAATNSDARLAIELFCYRIAKEMGAMNVALGGVDQIVFTGGIGEHDVRVRDQVCAQLSCLGVQLNPARNAQGQGLVSSDSSRCVVQALPSDEDAQIARHTWALCGLSGR